jgi:hypothetical protein
MHTNSIFYLAMCNSTPTVFCLTRSVQEYDNSMFLLARYKSTTIFCFYLQGVRVRLTVCFYLQGVRLQYVFTSKV